MVVRDDQAYRSVHPLHVPLNLCLLGPHVASANSIARLSDRVHGLPSVGWIGVLENIDKRAYRLLPMNCSTISPDAGGRDAPRCRCPAKSRARAPPRSRGRGATPR